MKSVATTSNGYNERAPEYAKMRAFVAGRKKVLEGETYLQRLRGHDDETYAEYSARSYLLNGTGRSVEGLVGLIFRNEPATEWPDKFTALADNATGAGHSAADLAEQVTDEVITVGMCGVLVEHAGTTEGMTQQQADASGARPYARVYVAESILGWKTEAIGAEQVLTQLRLKETAVLPVEGDEFAEKSVERIRVLDLEDKRVYRVRVYEKTDAVEQWVQVGGDEYPRRAGALLARIPFRFFTQRGGQPSRPRPPLLDLADTNCAHLNDSALYQWGLMWTANPTPCFINISLEKGEKIALGSSSGLVFKEGGRGEFMEFSGQGLAAIRQAMEDKRRDMAVLGARMLEEQRRQVEAAETAQIHRSGENSVLGAIANSVAAGMENVLSWVAEWAAIPGEIEYRLNTDFMPAALDAQTLTALMMAWQSGAISKKDLFDRLKRGEVIEAGKTFEEHEGELEGEPVLIDGDNTDG